MKKLLIIYATTEGQTAKVVRHMEKKAIELGWDVTGYNAVEYPPTPHGFDMVIVAGSVHMEKYQAALIHYATQNAVALTDKPNAFVSVSLSAAKIDEESQKGLDKCVEVFEKETGWKPQQVEHVAGALKYVEYNWMKKMVMREIARSTGSSTDTSQDHEFTDWNRLDSFMEEVLTQAAKTEIA